MKVEGYLIPMPKPDGTTSPMLPLGAWVVEVGNVEGHPTVWALVDELRRKEPVPMLMVETGQQVTLSPAQYIGTLLLDETEGNTLYHVFLLNEQFRTGMAKAAVQ